MTRLKKAKTELTGGEYDCTFRKDQFFRLKWKDKSTEQEWQKRLASAQRAYYRLEIETVAHDLRKCAVHIASPAKLPEIVEFLAGRDLYFLPLFKTPWEEKIACRLPPEEPAEPWKYHGVVGKSMEIVKKYKRAADEGEHEKIGRLLGYPECCISQFIEKDFASQGYYDPFWQIALETEADRVDEYSENYIQFVDFSPLLNFFFRRIGVVLFPHLPCSFHCSESLAASKKWLELGRDLSLEGIDCLIEILSLPVRWSCQKGIGQLKTPVFSLEFNSIPFVEKYTIELNPGSES